MSIISLFPLYISYGKLFTASYKCLYVPHHIIQYHIHNQVWFHDKPCKIWWKCNTCKEPHRFFIKLKNQLACLRVLVNYNHRTVICLSFSDTISTWSCVCSNCLILPLYFLKTLHYIYSGWIIIFTVGSLWIKQLGTIYKVEDSNHHHNHANQRRRNKSN